MTLKLIMSLSDSEKYSLNKHVYVAIFNVRFCSINLLISSISLFGVMHSCLSFANVSFTSLQKLINASVKVRTLSA